MNCMRGLVFALETCLRLGLLLQSGAPFDRSSKSWFILVRIVGPDRSGTWPPQNQRHYGQVWWVHGTHSCVPPRTFDSTASPPFEHCRAAALSAVNNSRA
jgi:hypothetical protein